MRTTTERSPQWRLSLGGRRTFTSLRVRNFRLYFLGLMTSQVGTWMTRVAQTLLVLDVTGGSGLVVGALAASQYAPVLLFSAWSGAIADRVDRWKLLVAIQFGAMLQSFALAAVIVSGRASVPAVLLLAGVQGVLTAFDSPVRRSFISDLVPLSALHNAISLNTAALTTSRVIGPALGGLVIATLGYGWCFALDGLSYVAVIAGLLAMRRSDIALRGTREAAGSIAGFRSVVRDEELRVVFIVMATVGTFALNLVISVPLMVHALGGSNVTFTLLYSVLSVGSLAGALVSARRKQVDLRDMTGVSLVFGVTMAAFAVTPNLWLVFPVAVAVGYASVAFTTVASSLVQIRARPDLRGRAAALQSMLLVGTTPIGGFTLGAVTDAVGARYAVGLGAGSCLLSSLYVRSHLRARPPRRSSCR